ncbi:MAG: hypothetical protein SF187_25885 [Deltaproteobacteria bacterium]|nr:hypothetical protein [Deltaproteobacteria bacterium]
MSWAISAVMFTIWVVAVLSSHAFHGFVHAFLAVAVATACASLVVRPKHPVTAEEVEL